MTRDLRNHGRLHADAVSFARDVQSLEATSCPSMIRFVRSAEQTLDALCADCAVELRALRPSTT